MYLCSSQEIAQALHRSDGKCAVLNLKEFASMNTIRVSAFVASVLITGLLFHVIA
jgi:hypothetical protein